MFQGPKQKEESGVVDAGEAGGDGVGAEEVERSAGGGAVEEERDCEGAAQEEEERDRDSGQGFIPEKVEGVWESAEGSPLGEDEVESFEEEHEAERSEDRGDFEPGDEEAGGTTGGGGGGESSDESGDGGEDGDAAGGGVWNEGEECECGGDAGEVADGDDGEVDAAGQEREHHGQCEEAEFRQLEGHTLEVGGAEEMAWVEHAHEAEREGEHEGQDGIFRNALDLAWEEGHGMGCEVCRGW
jgi:hypothetical protein